MDSRERKVHRVNSRELLAIVRPLRDDGEPGQRRSVFKVVVHLGEHATREDALAAWPGEMNRLRQTGRESKADKLQASSTGYGRCVTVYLTVYVSLSALTAREECVYYSGLRSH
jgi:hypothetical protein